MTDRIWDFPPLAVQDQLFHVPGQSVEGGFTAGGARITSPEPGGRSVLEMQISLQVNEWDKPFSSWLMSKINGQVFRVRLARTPQLITSRTLATPQGGTDNGYNDLYRTPTLPNVDLVGAYASVALEGSTVLTVDMIAFGNILRQGHVIGHGDNCYMVDDITYAGTVATIAITPPLRKNVAIGDPALFTPFFLGTISNGANFRVPYSKSYEGNIQPGNIIFAEAIV